MVAGPNFLSRLARRALAPPEVRPRLASRFETPAPIAANWLAAEEKVERAAAPMVSPVTTSATAVEPVGELHPRAEAPVGRSDPPPPPRIEPISRLTVPPLEPLAEPRAVPEIRAPAAAVPTPTQPAPLPELKLAVAPVGTSTPAPPHDVPAAPSVETSQPTVQLRHETLVQLVAAPAAAALATPDAPRLVAPQPVVPAPVPPLPRAAAASPPPIEITIGRIEIRATDEPEGRPSPAPAPRPPMLTLADYLRRRDGRVL